MTIIGRENSKLNLEGQSLEIYQAAVWGLEQEHHPIMNKLGGLGERSNRQTDVPQTLFRRVLDWYNFYLNHPGGSRFSKTIRKV